MKLLYSNSEAEGHEHEFMLYLGAAKDLPARGLFLLRCKPMIIRSPVKVAKGRT
jgi:hypothetical protein